jgi:hypothetical protein
VTSSSVACVERLEFSGVLRRYSVNKNELLRRVTVLVVLLHRILLGCDHSQDLHRIVPSTHYDQALPPLDHLYRHEPYCSDRQKTVN